VNAGRNFAVVFSLWLPRLAQKSSANVESSGTRGRHHRRPGHDFLDQPLFPEPKRESWS
jgi:hypothetical protein